MPGALLDYTVNGLIVGNIYMLLAVGLALIFGVSHLINFAHGSVYAVGAFIGWSAIHYLSTPLPATMLLVMVGCAVIGLAIERLGLRPLQNAPRIAPLLATPMPKIRRSSAPMVPPPRWMRQFGNWLGSERGSAPKTSCSS